MANPYDLERCLIGVAFRLAQKKYSSVSEFGRAVFPGKGSAYHTMLALQKPTSPGVVDKPRALKLREAAAIATALGVDLSDLIALAEKEAARSVRLDDVAPEANGTLGA